MFKNLFFKNVSLKLLALIMAIAAWAAIQQVTSFEETIYDVPLVIKHGPDWAVLDRTTNEFEIRFRGPKEDILQMDRKFIRVEVDVRGRALDEVVSLELKDKNVIFPGKAQVIAITPPSLRITLDKMGKKKVPVKANLIGELENGYTVDAVACDPPSVYLMGSEKRLEKLDLVETETLDISGRVQSFEAPATLVSPAVDFVDRMEPSKVRVSITVKLATTEKAFAGLPVSVLTRGPSVNGLVLEPAQVNMLVKGKPEVLEKLGPESLDVFVNCTRLEKGTQYELPVRVDLPPGLQVVDIEPSVITVRIPGKK